MSLLSLRSADVLIHLLRDFEDESVNHFCGTVDPMRDLEMVRQEIMLLVRYNFQVMSVAFILGRTCIHWSRH